MLVKGKAYAITRIPNIAMVSQDIARKEITENVCRELRNAGFSPIEYTTDRTTRCIINRVEESRCALTRMLPHYISQDTKTRVRNLLKEIEKAKKRRPRKPFKCPP